MRIRLAILAALVVFGLWAIRGSAQVEPLPVAAEPVGRYQMVAAPGPQVFVLDTTTGQVWRRVGQGQWIDEGNPTRALKPPPDGPVNPLPIKPATEKVNDVDVKVGNPQFTLVWDTRADLDLHVIEPGGSELDWEHRNSKQGGELDVDDVDGFGPENILWGGSGKPGGPIGEYKWFVHYYGGIGGLATPTRWKVRIKRDGRTSVAEGTLDKIDEKSKVFTFKVDPSEADSKGR